MLKAGISLTHKSTLYSENSNNTRIQFKSIDLNMNQSANDWKQNLKITQAGRSGSRRDESNYSYVGS